MNLPQRQDPFEYADLYTQLERLAPNLVGEIFDGRLHVHPRPAPKHALAATSLGDELVGPFQKGRGGPGGWWILIEPEIHFEIKTVVVVPDLAGWRRVRLPAMPDTAYFTVFPEWVCEILSPSNRADDLERKRTLYERYGVPYCWIIYPAAKTLEALVLEDGRYRLAGTFNEADQVRVVPFDAVAFDLGDLWA